MRYRICDVETIPHPDAGQWLEPVECDPKLLEPIEFDSRLKDPVKVEANRLDVERRRAERPNEIAASIAERTRERDDQLGLDPDCCRIVALGWHDVGYGDPVVMLCPDETQEAAALSVFWSTYDQQYTKLVTFNGFKFDQLVLMMRSLYLGVKGRELSVDRYRSDHIDLYDKLSFKGARRARGLQFYAKRLGLPMLDKVHGSQIAELVAAGDWDAVKAHNLSDLGYSHALANWMGELKL